MTTINERIKLLRKDNNLTQKQFADRILVTQSYLSRIESGKEIPNEKLIKLIALEFDVPTYWLRTGKGSKLINQDINDYFERGYNKEHQERLIVEIEEFIKFLQTQTVGIISVNIHSLIFQMKNYLEKSDSQSNSIHIIVFEKITSAMIEIFEKLKKMHLNMERDTFNSLAWLCTSCIMEALNDIEELYFNSENLEYRSKIKKLLEES